MYSTSGRHCYKKECVYVTWGLKGKSHRRRSTWHFEALKKKSSVRPFTYGSKKKNSQSSPRWHTRFFQFLIFALANTSGSQMLFQMPKATHLFWGLCFWGYPIYVLANLHKLEIVRYDMYGNIITDKVSFSFSIK